MKKYLLVQSVICSFVENMADKFAFFFICKSKLVETRSKPYFGGTVLKFALESISIKAISDIA